MNNGEQFEIKSIAELAMCYEVYEKEWSPEYSLDIEIESFEDNNQRFILKDRGEFMLHNGQVKYKTVPPPNFILQYREALKPKKPMTIDEVPQDVLCKYFLPLSKFRALYIIWKSWGTDASGLRMEFGPEFYAAFKDQIQEIEKALK
jgi:hypothetical protein